MRSLTTIEGKSRAEMFVAYLLTVGISTHVEPVDLPESSSAPENSIWEIWIRQEDKLAQAREELIAYQANPGDPKYAGALRQANQILREQREEARARQRNIQLPRLDSRSSLFRGKLPPLTLTLVILCCAFSFLTGFSQPEPENRLGFSIVKQLKFVDTTEFRKTNDPAASIKRGELWRIFTPAFLHGNILHLVMNMFALASLGRLVERLEGMPRYTLLLILVATGSHLLQGLLPENVLGIRGLSGSPNFVGISGVVLGLFGYIATKTQLHPELGFTLSGQAYFMVGVILFWGFAGDLFGNAGNIHMANFAHLGGLVSGVLIAFLSDRFRRNG